MQHDPRQNNPFNYPPMDPRYSNLNLNDYQITSNLHFDLFKQQQSTRMEQTLVEQEEEALKAVDNASSGSEFSDPFENQKRVEGMGIIRQHSMIHGIN